MTEQQKPSSAPQNPQTPGFLRSFAAKISDRLKKTEQSLMLEAMNPLWQIDAKRAQTIYDWARRGNFSQLQFLYNEIENCDATFLTCVTRRCSAIAELDWRIVRSNERLNRKADEGLVKAQIEFLEESVAKIDNLPDAFEHLALSAFRGFSVLNTHFGVDGMPNHLECLDHWNICYDRSERKWLWNPDASSYAEPSATDGKMTVLPPDDTIVVARKRQIDWPALMIFLRISVGERDWSRFLETYGLPPVIITMPDLTSEKEVNEYLKAAENVFEGRSGVVPFGSEVDYASESRGTNPFTDFIEHQMKLFVLLSTGGTLTSLAESGSGTLAGNAQMEVWKQIVRADTRILSNVFNKQLCEGLIKDSKDFRGKPVLAEFQLDTSAKLTPDEVADLAGKFSNAGYEMDENELSQLSGFTIRKKKEPDGGGFGLNGNPGRGIVVPDTSKTPPTPTQKAPEAAGGATIPPVASNAAEGVSGASGAASELAASLQDDFKAVADRLNAILAMPEEERAEAATKLRLELDSLIPDDPAMAEVIAEQMNEAFGEQIAKQPTGAAPAPNAVVANGHNPPCKVCGYETRKDGGCTHCETHGVSKTADKDGHSPEEQRSIAEYRASTNKNVVDFVERMQKADDETRNKSSIEICKAPQTLAKEVKDKLGVDVAGWKIELQGNHVRHIDKRHGENGKADTTMADPSHLGRLGYVMHHFDSVNILKDANGKRVFSKEYKGGDNKPSPVIEIRKRIDGRLSVQEAVPDTKSKTLKIVSAYIIKGQPRSE